MTTMYVCVCVCVCVSCQFLARLQGLCLHGSLCLLSAQASWLCQVRITASDRQLDNLHFAYWTLQHSECTLHLGPEASLIRSFTTAVQRLTNFEHSNNNKFSLCLSPFPSFLLLLLLFFFHFPSLFPPLFFPSPFFIFLPLFFLSSFTFDPKSWPLPLRHSLLVCFC